MGSSYLNHKAQGSFCRIQISVKNATKSAHLFYFDVPKRTKLTTIVFDAGLFTLAEHAVVTL